MGALAMVVGHCGQRLKEVARQTDPGPDITASSPAQSQPAGKVVGVHDGDTITVYAGEGKPQIKVRLAGIDAPELKQAYGNAAKQALSEMVFGKPVELQVSDVDRYGRTVATVIVAGADANLAMVRAGMAWHYKAYSKRQDLAAAEQEARAARRGLWQDGAAVAPWEFRKKSSK